MIHQLCRIPGFVVGLLLLSTVTALTLDGKFSSALSPTTLNLSLRAEITLSESVSIHQHSHLFQTNFPFPYYLPYAEKIVRWQRMIQSSESFIRYQNKSFLVAFGKMHQPSDPGQISGVFLSPESPPIEQLMVGFISTHFKYQYHIMRLDNRHIEDDQTSPMVNRWYYLRRIAWSPSANFTIGFVEGMVSTGVGRQPEWYYLNPLNPFLLDENHETAYRYANSSGDSDNALVGIDMVYQNDPWRFYTEWIIDEIQIDAEDRKNWPHIFGGMMGMSHTDGSQQITMEWSYASPWLYLHNGLFTNLEKYGYPLGLRSPMSQFIDINYQNTFNQSVQIDINVHLQQRGDQGLTESWNGQIHKINYFGFTGIEKPELRLNMNWLHGWPISLWISHNQFQSDETHFGIEWSYSFSYSEI